ncbi:MAG: hypothetical protein COU06_02095 [Candidatus Harrisonbacteria bacterium CG10_big_fil_rev_8_21_14_0_10_38_8]|uniref:DUF4015 domain-containing protein n=1 Tax=Candidatus Harrisonbacteria bacterium CG10_big_fil_rev_8_21_14_0_10_38_8 TaxID=1974582 RepID=A0A2M6WJT7_9BACT|nr:MAG: hypothetical protein COU06_02095 [Candidatus Harrisonbacteria bacterium CG10_big_fil_rev_8_21_14_0_10_38_8]
MKKIVITLLIGGLLVGGFILLTRDSYVISYTDLVKLPEVITEVVNPDSDIEKQKPLKNPPRYVKAVYATSWSAASTKKLAYFMNLFNTTELNAIVIDIKDYTGLVSYLPDVPQVKEYDAYEVRISKINKLIKMLHDNNVYVIGRVAVFEDTKLAMARPELALKDKRTGEIWRTNKDIAWVDPASREVWDYNIAIANDALNRGFDEVNFDYVRFPSDGSISNIDYPFYTASTTLKSVVIGKFFNYLATRLPRERISADVFGDVAHARIDIGVGQILEDTFDNFVGVYPMTYPSHYAKNFLGLAKPAEHPYEVMKYSVDHALTRLAKYYEASTSTPPFMTRVRPWIQDFDLGADYDADKVRAQIQAIDDAVILSTSTISASELKGGWAIWSPSNNYTVEALR